MILNNGLSVFFFCWKHYHNLFIVVLKEGVLSFLATLWLLKKNKTLTKSNV